jgi:hypothetical protein
MGRTTNVVAGVALAAFSVALTEEIREGLKHVQLHVPASLYATATASMVTSTTNEIGSWDCGPFRAIYAQGIERLADDVSEHRNATDIFRLA